MTQVSLSYYLDMDPESAWLTVTPNQIAKNTIAYVQELGDFITHERFYTRREGLPSYLIKYTLSGEGELQYNDQTYTVSPGQGFWIDCHHPQFYHTSAKTKEWHILWVHFYGGMSAKYYELFMSQNNGSNLVTLPPRNNVESVLRRLISVYSGGESNIASDIYASGLLTELMVQFTVSSLSQMEPAGMPECVRDARTYLFSHYVERITLDDLSNRYSINKYYFQKLFKRHTGFTPNEFLIATRLNRAKELLRTTDRSISQISADVGVENVSHFINLFKKHENLTPNTFRQNWYGQ